jgi:DNA repair protein RadC
MKGGVWNWLLEAGIDLVAAGEDRMNRRGRHAAAPGFSYDSPSPNRQGLRDVRSEGSSLEFRPPAIDGRPHRPASDRLSRDASAGGGFVRDGEGRQRPHYWGHRERLRTRFLAGGQDSMPDYELLELVLFDAIPRIDVKPLAKRLLAEFDDLPGVVAAPKHRLLKVEGATDRVHYQLRLLGAVAGRVARARVIGREIISSWDALIDYCRTMMARREVEEFRVLFLDRANTLVADEALGRGTVDHVPAYPREIARRALELNASAIVLVHNHPSGDPMASQDDIETTRLIVQACRAIGVEVHDHVIVAADGESSMRMRGLI